MTGLTLIRWMIRLSMLAYAGFLWLDLRDRMGRLSSSRKWLWTIGWLFFVVHLIAAFHFYHGWSHTHAFDHVADETEKLLGARFGFGIYFSYFFLAIWTLDVAWLWLARKSYDSRSKSVRLAIHAYIFFIAFNGTVVFESGPVRIGALIACVALTATLFKQLGGTAKKNG